jgi:hypothetical protein
MDTTLLLRLVIEVQVHSHEVSVSLSQLKSSKWQDGLLTLRTAS